MSGGNHGGHAAVPWLDIVIVNWNGRALIEPCIDSVRASARRGFELGRLVVVDNASGDGSVSWLAAQPDCTLIANVANRGFAAACNQGAAVGEGDFVLFLNPDVVLAPDTLAAATGYLAQAPADVGIVGAQLRDRAGRLQRSCARFPTPWRLFGQCAGLDRWLPALFPPHFLDEQAHTCDRGVDQVMGAFFLARRDLFERLGGFDEQYFMYFEDLDFALRARRAGFRSVHVAAARAMHAGGGTTAHIPVQRLYYRLCSRPIFSRKHFTAAGTTLVLAGTLLVEPVARLVHGLSRGGVIEAGQVLRAYGRFVRALPRLLAQPLRTPRLTLRQEPRRAPRRRLPSIPPSASGVARPEVLLFTMGKVGTTSLQKALCDNGVVVHKAHCIDVKRLRHKIAGDRARGRVLKTDLVALDIAQHVLPRAERIRTVTLVRESIGRNMSGFFETLWRRGIHPPYDRVDVKVLCRQFLEEFNHARPDQWFRQDFGPAIGTDPFRLGFDPVRGYGRFECGRHDVLLMQLELDDGTLGAVIGEFVGVRVPIRSRHQSRNKAYGELYGRFKRAIRFPEAFLRRSMDSDVMQAFYSAAQREHIARYYRREIATLHPLPRG